MKTENQSALFSRKTAVIATLVLVSFALVFALVRQSGNTIDSPFPQRTGVHVALKPAKANEDLRLTTTWPDGTTPMNERIERKNGETVYRTFTHSGKLREVKEYYPLPDDKRVKPALNEDGSLKLPSSQPYVFDIKGRQLKSFITFSDNGLEVLTTELYRPDGAREVVGKRLPDGSFQNLVFHKDGLTLSVSQLFARNGALITEQQFAEGGSRLIASSQREADGFLHSKTFREDGTLLSVGILKPTEQVIDFFREDGVTRRMTVTNTSYQVTTVYFRADGEAVSKRVFAADGDMTVTELVPGSGHFGPLGVVEKAYTERQTQTWEYIAADTAKNKPASFLLSKLVVFDANGKMLRQFHFNSTTGVLEKIWMYENGVNTHDRAYNPDGTLKDVPWKGSDDFSKKYNDEHGNDADRQPGAKVSGSDLDLIKSHGSDIEFEDPRPFLSKVEAPAPQYNDHHGG